MLNKELDHIFSNLPLGKLSDYEFLYKKQNSELNLELGVFGENNVPCIGIDVKEAFLHFQINENYKVIKILNSPKKFGQKILILLNEKKHLHTFKNLYKWIYLDLQENKNLIKTFDNLIEYIDQYSYLFQKRKINNSEESYIGLYGELSILYELLKQKKFNETDLIKSWSGYSRSTHDFNLPKLNLEIKSSISDKMEINVSSFNQLIPKPNSQTYLIYQQFIKDEQCNQSKDLFEIVSSIKTIIRKKENVKLFTRKLEVFGINQISIKLKLSKINLLIFHINETFPSLKSAEIHESISNIKYKIELSKCSEWLTELNLNEL